jgi:hypothetical protein
MVGTKGRVVLQEMKFLTQLSGRQRVRRQRSIPHTRNYLGRHGPVEWPLLVQKVLCQGEKLRTQFQKRLTVE